LLGAQPVLVGAEKKPSKGPAAFGVLVAPGQEQVRTRALNWLTGVGKADATNLKKFDEIWKDADRPTLDKVTASLSLGDPQVAKLLAEAADSTNPAPTEVPAVLKDKKKPAFYRANLALAYGKALANRRVYEEALDALRSTRPEEVVDPASYFFDRAVCEHALLKKEDAARSVVGLLEDVNESPERYKFVGLLMLNDMGSWREKDLGEIARKMDNIERRLELARGGPQTQKIQKEVVLRLDELIKKLEAQAKGNSNGGSCPGSCPDGSGGSGTGTPMQDSKIARLDGKGDVGNAKLKNLAAQWGKLPEKERVKAMQDLTRDMPPRYRELIENYFKKSAVVDLNK